MVGPLLDKLVNLVPSSWGVWSAAARRGSLVGTSGWLILVNTGLMFQRLEYLRGSLARPWTVGPVVDRYGSGRVG